MLAFDLVGLGSDLFAILQSNAASAPRSQFFDLSSSTDQEILRVTVRIALTVKASGDRVCENHAFDILQKVQEGKIPHIKEEGREMLVVIVLDRPLVEAQKLVGGPDAPADALVQTMIIEWNRKFCR